MNRAVLDPRVWAPLVVAAVCFGLRWRPMPPATTLPTSRSVALPLAPAAPAPKSDSDWDLDQAKSTVRFLVEGHDGELLTACTRVQGRLHLAAKGDVGELELELDLGSLQPIAPSNSRIDLHRLLGVHHRGEIHYHATLIRSSTSNLPGITERVWLGTLRLGTRVLRQPMQLWQCALLGQPLRLQGHGTVDVADYGLPRRRWLGLLQEHHVVTLGLDLAWRRRSTR